VKVHILDDWFDTLRTLPCFEKLTGHDVTVWTDHVQETSALADRLQDADAVVLFRERTSVSRELLEQLPNLRLISQRGVYPHVDVEACTDTNTLLCSKLPKGGAANYAASELTWGLILAGMRQIPHQMASLKAGQWQMGVGKSVRNRTIGLVGFGRIGGAVAEVARAFGMKVQWWGSEAGRERARAAGEHIPNSREEFFATSDVVSLHVRLNGDTRGMITAADFQAMKNDALFVNTSRAGLIAPGALLEALNQAQIGMAALDVFDVEPLTDATDALLAHDRLIGTPHIGFVTQDEFNKQFGDVFDQIAAYAAGEPIHMINPEVWKG